MDIYVKQSITVREEFFSKYYTVPDDISEKINKFMEELYSLGEECKDAAEFESRFASEGYSERFNTLLTSCTPKAVTLTPEQQAYADSVKTEFRKENKGITVKDIAKDVADTVMVEIEEESIAMKRKAMIEADVYDDYTRTTNQIDNAKSIFGFFKKKFGKGKDK